MERELFVVLIRALGNLHGAHVRPPKASFSTRDIILVYLWAVLHDRPVSWACRRCNWPWHDRTRALPSDATMSRRLRTARVRETMERLRLALRVPSLAHPDLLLLDAKPCPVSGHSADPEAKCGRAGNGMARGYKGHCITDAAGNVREYLVAPMNLSEVAMARILLMRLAMSPGMVLLADGNYDCNDLYELAARRGVQLIAASRRKAALGLGHKRHSPHRLHAIEVRKTCPDVLERRRLIEGQFGTLGNRVGGLSPLPNHVRRHHRVERWWLAKLIIDATHRLRKHRLAIA